MEWLFPELPEKEDANAPEFIHNLYKARAVMRSLCITDTDRVIGDQLVLQWHQYFMKLPPSCAVAFLIQVCELHSANVVAPNICVLREEDHSTAPYALNCTFEQSMSDIAWLKQLNEVSIVVVTTINTDEPTNNISSEHPRTIFTTATAEAAAVSHHEIYSATKYRNTIHVGMSFKISLT